MSKREHRATVARGQPSCKSARIEHSSSIQPSNNEANMNLSYDDEYEDYSPPTLLPSSNSTIQNGEDAFTMSQLPSSNSSIEIPQPSQPDPTTMSCQRNESPILIPDSQDNALDGMNEIQYIPSADLRDALIDIDNYEEAAITILDDANLREAIMKELSKTITSEWKSCLKVSKLTADNKERDYLLGINPTDLCIEFKHLCPTAYHLVIEVLLGMKDDKVVGNQYLQNRVSLLFSIFARIKNRKATGLALFMGMLARDGGLKEERLKDFPEFCHPRTLAKYDYILAAQSEVPLECKLTEEKQFIHDVSKVMQELDNLSISRSDEETASLQLELQNLNNNAPKMLTTVWDNLNIRAKHRHERINDRYEDNNYDYMTSINVEERISADHLENNGKAFKRPEELTLEDFIPGKNEKELLFCSMVPMYSFSLLKRYPQMFKSLKSSIKDHIPHQFQAEMSQKSKEFTGQIFEKSENKTEDLVSMIDEYQSKMVIGTKLETTQRILFRRQLSGDQKTEKGSHSNSRLYQTKPTPTLT